VFQQLVVISSIKELRMEIAELTIPEPSLEWFTGGRPKAGNNGAKKSGHTGASCSRESMLAVFSMKL